MFIKPCQGLITSFYDMARKNPVTGIVRPHWGIDYGNHENNDIVAAADGTVRLVVNGTTGFGKYIIITHPNGWETVYAHLAKISVNAGQIVKQGQQIGVKGTTGNSTGIHLHFEISKGKWSNKYTHHVDPALYIDDPDVRDLQTKLNLLGYNVSVDGKYGNRTKVAVTDYQRKHKLLADGVAGRVTMSVIDKDITNIKQDVSQSTVSVENKEVDIMAELLPDTQKKDMRKLLQRALDEKVFTVNHVPKVDTMTRSEAIDLLISYVARS